MKLGGVRVHHPDASLAIEQRFPLSGVSHPGRFMPGARSCMAVGRSFPPFPPPTKDYPMNIEELMTRNVETPQDMLSRAAQIMWERDCGCVPVVDASRHLMGILTDRDICMAAYTKRKPLD